MNKTAEIAVLWAKFEEENPKADVADFCQAYLTTKKKTDKKADFWHSPVPPDSASLLTKLIGRINKLHSLYAEISFKDCGISSFDEFLYLNSIITSGNPKKTEVIYANFTELSSGLLILDRLKKAKLITEQEDAYDKRSKRLQMTKKGKQILENCYHKLTEVNKMCFGELTEHQINLCTQFLVPVESALATQWLEDKKK